MAISINGSDYAVPDDPRVSLAGMLRDQLHLAGTKIGCNQGGCGACTVLLDGQRVLACLTLAVQADGHRVTTIEGMSQGADLHPLQTAFLAHDGFQCGYCTPGQICAADAMLRELAEGVPSYLTPNIAADAPLTADEIRERMSGNLCRCGAHHGIVAAILQVAQGRAA